MYNTRERGPHPTRAFTVLSGLAVVEGQGGAVTLCPGATWPGTAHLSADLAQHLCPTRTSVTPGTQVLEQPATPREIELADALVRGQLLRSGPLPRRLAFLGRHVPLGELNRRTCAVLLGASDAHVRKAMQAAS